jgi:hypothetical protein
MPKRAVTGPIDVPPDRSVIDAGAWMRQRWGWTEAVRKDADLSPMARLVAHVLALDYANAKTAVCYPSHGEIASAVGASKATIRRAVSELVSAKWVARKPGRGRGHNTGYSFLTRAQIVALKGVTDDHLKGCTDDTFCDVEKGSDLHRKGVRSAHPHKIDNNHIKTIGAEGAKPVTKKTVSGWPIPRLSENPVVQAEAARAVQTYRDGRRDVFDDLQPFILAHIGAAALLTVEEIDAVENAQKGGA